MPLQESYREPRTLLVEIAFHFALLLYYCHIYLLTTLDYEFLFFSFIEIEENRAPEERGIKERWIDG